MIGTVEDPGIITMDDLEKFDAILQEEGSVLLLSESNWALIGPILAALMPERHQLWSSRVRFDHHVSAKRMYAIKRPKTLPELAAKVFTVEPSPKLVDDDFVWPKFSPMWGRLR